MQPACFAEVAVPGGPPVVAPPGWREMVARPAAGVAARRDATYVSQRVGCRLTLGVVRRLGPAGAARASHNARGAGSPSGL